MIEGGLLLVTLVHPATLDLHHHAIDLVLGVVTIIPLLNEGIILDLSPLRTEDTVEKDHIRRRVGRGHTHALQLIMGARGVVVTVLQRVQVEAEVQVRTMMLRNQPVVGPPVSEKGEKRFSLQC